VPYDHLIIATGLVTDTRIAQRAGLAFNRGIVVEPTTLQTSDQHIFALGDCVSFDGAPCRFVEPIPQQAVVIASHVVQREKSTYQHIQPVIRLKTRSLPIVIRGVPDTDGRWHTIREDKDALVMEQYVDQQAIALLTLDLSRQTNAA
jgi:rubredoxin-NAD+ reductase